MSSEKYSKDRVEKKVRKIVRLIVIGLMVFLFVAPLLALFIQFLWNATLTPIFGLSPITYLQAIGLFILAKLFFGFGGHSEHRGRRSHGSRGGKNYRTWWQSEGKEAYRAFKAKEDEKTEA